MESSLKAYLIVFVSSACVLVLEIVAGRLLAPTIGVSLYTWTSIIGVVLAGISIGNFVGGIVADRFPSPATLGLILLAGGISSLSVLPLVGLASDAFLPLPVLARIVAESVLHATRALELLGQRARPALPALKRIFAKAQDQQAKQEHPCWLYILFSADAALWQLEPNSSRPRLRF